MKSLKHSKINLVMLSSLSSSPGIREANNPGKHKINSSKFRLNKIFLIIISIIFSCFAMMHD